MSAMLYGLTADAAQMCTPVPAAVTGGFVDWLDHWQTLLGAAVGGVMGVAGAWIVAAASRSREQRIAAGMVHPDLQQITASAGLLERWLDNAKHVHDGDRPEAAVEQLRRRRPILFALHSPVIGQLTDIDARLYSHLFHCEMTHRSFEDGMAALQASQDQAQFAGHIPRSERLYGDWQRATAHATLATYYLDRLVFSRWPRWLQLLRMKWMPNDLDRQAAHLLRTGEFLPGVHLAAMATQSAEPA